LNDACGWAVPYLDFVVDAKPTVDVLVQVFPRLGVCNHIPSWRNSFNAADDGGANSDYSLCDFGTDCTDCGDRSSAMLLQQKDSKKVKNEAAAKAKKVAAEAKELVREKAISKKKAKKASAKAKKAAAGSGGGSGSGAGVQA